MNRTYLKAFEIGIVAGMRSMLAPAFVSNKLAHHKTFSRIKAPYRFLLSPKIATVLDVMAGGELIGDKLPSAPDRIGQPQLWGRIASGAMSGAALAKAAKQPVAYGVVLGAAGALAGSFAFYHLRHWLTHEKNLPDTVVAMGEDALALGAAWAIVNQR